jgi:hypothetical protein
MSLVMYDAIYVSSLPPGAAAYAGYAGGRWPTFPELQKTFPKAHLLSIAVTALSDADCLDVEQGDATIGQVYAWFTRQVTRGVPRPCIYTSQANVGTLVAAMTANGVARSAYRIWAAHYGRGAHVCSPAACGAAVAVDGTQWTDQALGRSLDQSQLNDDFFDSPPDSGDNEMTSSVTYWNNGRYLACVGTDKHIYYMGPETNSKWVGIPDSHVQSGVSLAISTVGEKTIFYTNTSGQPCMYVAKPGSDTWVWSSLPGNVL